MGSVRISAILEDAFTSKSSTPGKRIQGCRVPPTPSTFRLVFNFFIICKEKTKTAVSRHRLNGLALIYVHKLFINYGPLKSKLIFFVLFNNVGLFTPTRLHQIGYQARRESSIHVQYRCNIICR